jgi:hypothetical protein
MGQVTEITSLEQWKELLKGEARGLSMHSVG